MNCTRRTRTLALLTVLIAVTGCVRKAKLGTLAVDIYLHPEAGSMEDTLLLTAVRKSLSENKLTASGIYARVLERKVVLTGSVTSQQAKDTAAALALEARVTLNDKETIAPSDVINRITVNK
jgi:BON domain